MDLLKEDIIGELVAKDYRTASVFKKHGIDFCCQGNRTIDDACVRKNIDVQSVVKELDLTIHPRVERAADYQSWPLDLLADHIETKHHRYVAAQVLEIKPYLDRICSVHGDRNLELFLINEHFVNSARALARHMIKEELVLFPYVRRIVRAKQEKSKVSMPPFGTVQNPIEMMLAEHESEGERFKKISELSNNYTVPKDACNTYRVTFALLKEFEDDLLLHIHLENNILFPNAIRLEQELSFG